MNPIFMQAIYYAVVMLLSFFAVGLILRGFFWKYVKVRLSFGRLVMVKIKAVNRDHYAIGEIQDGFLVFTQNKDEKRISIPGNEVFYRSLAVSWIDINEDLGAIIRPDYKGVEGFDAIKYSHLYKRALYRPQIADKQDKILIGLGILIVIGLIAVAFFVYKQNYLIQTLGQQVATLSKGAVVGTATI